MSDNSDIQLRPKYLSEYIGQKRVVDSLRLFVDAIKKRGKVSEHLLFYGPPGLGKTTLSYIVANELGGELKITSGPAIEKAGDLAAILTNLNEGDVLFIDEIHRLSKSVEEVLYPVMEEFALDIVIGKGPAARSVRLPVPPVTIIGATTRIAMLSTPLRDRFGMLLRLDPYENSELERIIKRSSELLDLKIPTNILSKIASRSRQTPRIANRILRRVRDLQETLEKSELSEAEIDRLFEMLSIDDKGLSDLDQSYLRILIDKFAGGPAGMSTLASALSEDTRTVEEFIEPFLLKIGFIKKTPQGRVATEQAWAHLGKKAKIK